ncbi:PD-(D/E)XK nuclease family protein [Jannaschia rubra]|uniref:PD-(D/E)XK nuclease family protein n=1 Tax=Jannaschia rubra TaxID=282197 RepID=UPI002492857B|nr:PD-(D/E)XK nuclease family protein [Jannaschia rubra]
MIRGLHAEPMGVDFSRTFAEGLRARLARTPPEAMARVILLVNTSRMARRIEAALAETGATLLPRIGLVSDLAPLLPPGDAPVAGIAPLALRLRLTRLVARLLEARPDLSPPSAAFDLAGSLATLLAEMEEEAMDAEALSRLDVADLSIHWQRSLDFLRIATDWLAADGTLTSAGAQALALDRLLTLWAEVPPSDPVIVAGSTASRAPTRRLMRAVLDLPQGAVILPGLDDAMPDEAWAGLTAGDGPGQQDHPQYRHAALLADLGLTRAQVPRWGRAAPAVAARNRLISLALRPAPATDAWLEEGPLLNDVAGACAGITLLRAPSPGAEAAAIATGLRAALEQGRRAALITPDRVLSRQVAAQLDRWGILPDDSAGRPLHQSTPGRLLLQTAAMRGRPVEAEALAIVLKHPLTHAGGDRATHLARAREVEVALLRSKPLPFPTRAAFDAWLDGRDTPRDGWDDWLGQMLDAMGAQPATAPLADHAAGHRALVEALVRGCGSDAGPLWSDEAGRKARAVLDALADAAPERGEPVEARDYDRILHALLSAEEVRETYSPHPDVMIWGALEARARNADLVILGGLTDDVWPGQPTPDPWLNRPMRTACGLRLPERSVGLSAHDFQQAAAGPEVWLSRAMRTAEADTVPSRWLNRIEGLLAGIGPEGEAALAAMRARGDRWLALADRLHTPDPARHAAARAPRPAPRLPAGVTLDRLSVTGVETLIRDPYAIYARQILRLSPLDPLRQGPDARLRGTAVHDAMERFTRATPDALPEDAARLLHEALEQALDATAPWPGHRRLWLGRFARVTADLVAAEAVRRARGRPLHVERKGELRFADPPFTLTARADRIDDRGTAVAIYDYKTGTLPSHKQQEHFAKQLLFEALMVTEGAFPDIPQREVEEVRYLSVGSGYAETGPKSLDADVLAETRVRLLDLIRRYATGAPFIARLAPDMMTWASSYDHLSRHGEWADTDAAVALSVGNP